MATDDRVADFLARNKTFAQNHTAAPLYADLIAKPTPHPRINIISCFDDRANPRAFFGLRPNVHITDGTIRTKLKERAPEKAAEIEGMEFGEIENLHESLKHDMSVVKSSPYLRKDLIVLGFVFDITHGTVEEIKMD
ncbi:hypothetical protein MMC28_010549 [Mycoblastus sanguinarius]|nr:hypothetical protein [Mycoblastus sanguinarius]